MLKILVGNFAVQGVAVIINPFAYDVDYNMGSRHRRSPLRRAMSSSLSRRASGRNTGFFSPRLAGWITPRHSSSKSASTFLALIRDFFDCSTVGCSEKSGMDWECVSVTDVSVTGSDTGISSASFAIGLSNAKGLCSVAVAAFDSFGCVGLLGAVVHRGSDCTEICL